MLPNRIAIYLTTLAGLCTALAPAVADLDSSSTVGLITGFAGIAAIAFKFLEGWQRYEERTDLEALADVVDASETPDQS